MPQTPLASIIIPTWNGQAFIEACLTSVLAQVYPKFEVIVVDNASSDGTPVLVAEKFSTVHLLQNDRNLGFAGGVNVGLRAASGDILILLNQDVVLNPGWLQALSAGLLSAPDVGLAGCKILNLDSPVIQHAGGYLAMPLALPGHYGLGQLDEDHDEEMQDVDFVTGAALAIQRRVVDTIGYFDESFFFYFEDVDYCYRARAAGFRVVYVPAAVLHHHDKASLGAGTAAYFANFHTSRLQFVLKHAGAAYFVAQFQPAEKDRLNQITSLAERVGLRQAYQHLLEEVGWMGKELSLKESSQTELLTALRELREQVYAHFPAETEAAPQQTPGSAGQTPPEGWWEVKERPFVSPVPLIGPMIARFRTLWNNVSTTWFVRALLQQQNHVNRMLVLELEKQNQILEMQSQILRDLDRDQTRLTTRIAEVLHRLDKIEARLDFIEQQPEKL